MEEEEKMEKVNGGCECKNSLKRSLRQKKRRWSWERGYKKGQGIRMSQDYGRCREMGKGG
jgi:hypothetical protein